MGSFERIRNWYRTYRYGGVTGLNYVSANAKMTSVVALPWLIGYLLCFMFVPDPFLEFSICAMSTIWIFYCYGIYAYAKVDATRYRPMPQALMRFPDGGQKKYDLMIPPDGFTKECDFTDGTSGWRVNFGKRLQYWDRRSDFPFVFDYGLFRLPAEKPDECFEFQSEGEYFHKGIMVKTPACENVSFHVHGWVQDKEGQYVPVGEVYDCSLAYRRSLNNDNIMSSKELTQSQFFAFAFKHERSRRMLESQHGELLEEKIDADKKFAREYLKDVEDGITKIRNLVKTILDTEKPLIQRIKANLVKILLIGLGIFVFLWVIGVIRF